MAFKISNADQKRIALALGAVTTRRDTLEDAVRVFNEKIAAARAELQLEVDAFNELIQDVRGKIEDVHRELDEEFDGRSDNWKDGDKGQTTREWIDSIETIGLELADASLDAFPESLGFEEVVGDDQAEGFSELDKEPTE